MKKTYIYLLIAIGLLCVGAGLGFQKYRHDTKEAEKQLRINNQTADWVYTIAPKELSTVLFFGENDQNQLLSETDSEPNWYYRSKELIVEDTRLPLINERYYIQEVSKKQERRVVGDYPIPLPRTKQFELLVYQFQEKQPVYEITIDVLALVEQDEQYQAYWPMVCYNLVRYADRDYVPIGLSAKEDLSPQSGKLVYVNLSTGEIEKDETVSRYLSQPVNDETAINLFLDKTNFLAQWGLKKSLTIYDLQDYEWKSYLKMTKSKELDLSSRQIGTTFPELALYLEKGMETDLFLRNLSLETLIGYLIPEGEKPFEGAGSIIYTTKEKQEVVLHSLEEFYEVASVKK